MTTNPIRLALCDDHAIFMDGLRSALQKDKEIEVVGEAQNAEALFELLARQPIDVLLLDIEMPGPNGIEVAERLARDYPAVAVIVLSMHDETATVLPMVRLGVRGYLTKNIRIDDLIEAIKKVAEGEAYFKGAILSRIIEFTNKSEQNQPAQLLTERELEVLQLLAKGLTNVEISRELFISVHTVNTHRKNLIRKLQVKNIAGLLRAAYSHKLIQD